MTTEELPSDPDKPESVCPDCGGIHGAVRWEPNPMLNVDRDLTAIVMAILNDGTVRDFAELVGDEERMGAMLLRACQYIAQLFLTCAHLTTGSGDPQIALDVARDMLSRTLLAYAEGRDPNAEEEV